MAVATLRWLFPTGVLTPAGFALNSVLLWRSFVQFEPLVLLLTIGFVASANAEEASVNDYRLGEFSEGLGLKI